MLFLFHVMAPDMWGVPTPNVLILDMQGQKQSGFPPGAGRDGGKKKQEVCTCMCNNTCTYMYIVCAGDAYV